LNHYMWQRKICLGLNGEKNISVHNYVVSSTSLCRLQISLMINHSESKLC